MKRVYFFLDNTEIRGRKIGSVLFPIRASKLVFNTWKLSWRRIYMVDFYFIELLIRWEIKFYFNFLLGWIAGSLWFRWDWSKKDTGSFTSIQRDAERTSSITFCIRIHRYISQYNSIFGLILYTYKRQVQVTSYIFDYHIKAL